MLLEGQLYYWGDNARHIPEKPGVYALYDKDKVLIYIGKSSDLRKEFTSYLNTDFGEDPCKRETIYYKREFTSSQEEEMRELLEEYRKTNNKLPRCNSHTAALREKVDQEMAFHFYEAIGKPLGEVAVTLEDLRERIETIPISSIEFHQTRGDFRNWIKEVLKNPQLAESIHKLEASGQKLRSDLLMALNNPKTDETACPECGVKTPSIKTWKMAGRPSKTGERLQLTIGLYKCSECNKTFRHVLAKEKIKAS